MVSQLEDHNHSCLSDLLVCFQSSKIISMKLIKRALFITISSGWLVPLVWGIWNILTWLSLDVSNYINGRRIKFHFTDCLSVADNSFQIAMLWFLIVALFISFKIYLNRAAKDSTGYLKFLKGGLLVVFSWGWIVPLYWSNHCLLSWLRNDVANHILKKEKMINSYPHLHFAGETFFVAAIWLFLVTALCSYLIYTKHLEKLRKKLVLLPIEYRWLMEHGFKLLTPWHFLEEDEVDGIRKEYQLETDLDFLPFARRQDSDDVAGFVIENNDIKKEVLSVHLTWSSKREREGYPFTTKSDDLICWLNDVMLEDTKDWISEEAIDDVEACRDE